MINKSFWDILDIYFYENIDAGKDFEEIED